MIPIDRLQRPHASVSNEVLPFWLRLSLFGIRWVGKSKLAYKLHFYHALMDFVRVIIIHMVVKNGLKQGFIYAQDPFLEHLAELIVHFGLGEKQGNYLRFNGLVIDKVDTLALGRWIDAPGELKTSVKGIDKTMQRNYTRVFDLVKLYRDKASESKALKNIDIWKCLLAEGILDYEVRLAETLFQLTRWEFGKKIPSPFNEAYYSESGRNAFENFTRHRFLEILDEIPEEARKDFKVLDVGCGYGNYIEALEGWHRETSVHGFELQQDLFEKGKERFEINPGVRLFNENILSYETKEKYDLVLLNYVLFYFSKEQKIELFKRLKSMLSDKGRILICQYYPGIEPLKYQLASLQTELTLSRKIEMFYGNKILYANALWNQVASTFSEAERWPDFLDTLKVCGLHLSRITNADRFYYSLFVEVSRD